MTALRSAAPLPRALLLALVAAALALRLLVPQGWMPATGAGGMRLVLCSGAGPAMAMPGRSLPAGHDHHGDDRHGDDHGCPFAALAATLAGPALAALALPGVVWRAPPRRAAATVAVGRGLAAPPPPSTGPPHRS